MFVSTEYGGSAALGAFMVLYLEIGEANEWMLKISGSSSSSMRDMMEGILMKRV